MLNKTISLLMMICLLGISNLFVFGQTQLQKTENSQQSSSSSKKDFLDRINVSSSDRANELLDKDSFIRVKKGNITEKVMQDADNKAQQKKKFSGLNTTTAVVIAAAVVAAIIIVVAAKGGDDHPGNIPCDPGPCR